MTPDGEVFPVSAGGALVEEAVLELAKSLGISIEAALELIGSIGALGTGVLIVAASTAGAAGDINKLTEAVQERIGGSGDPGGGRKGDSNSPKVNYKGEESPVYRGRDDFTVKSNEIKVNPETGNVKTSHGVSLDVNPDTVSKFGGAYKIKSLPEGLKIVQRGMRAEHFEIVPAYEMPLETFQELLNQIVVSGPY